jgi:acyl dehydratase
MEWRLTTRRASMSNAELPAELQKYIGRISRFVEGADEVNKAMIRIWCEMVEDANPLYTDEEYARESEHGGIISPPSMIMTWAMPQYWPAADLPPDALLDQMDLPLGGFPMKLSLDFTEEYFLPLRLGDKVHYKTRLDSISPLKKTRVGSGHFITTTTYYYNQRGELVTTHKHVLFRYRTT